MIKTINLTLQLLTLVFYCTAIFANNIELVSPYSTEVRWLAIALVVIHTSEFIFVRKRLLAVESNMLKALSFTMLFGVTYWQPLIKKPSVK